jgi:FtsH-binding integral membrane protein
MNQMQSEKVKSSYILFVVYVALMSFLIGVQIGMWAQHKFAETVAMPSNVES